jgi:hypothetical protein
MKRIPRNRYTNGRAISKELKRRISTDNSPRVSPIFNHHLAVFQLHGDLSEHKREIKSAHQTDERKDPFCVHSSRTFQEVPSEHHPVGVGKYG